MSKRLHHAPDCHCCSGVDADTPRRISNPPGLSSIDYRIGRHGDFLESIQARLSSADNPALAALTTRESSDFTIALSDALATSLDVLSFYTERYAHEHYLRTATERLSVLEMARLIGYQLNPGVAAGTHLAFTLQATPGAPAEPIEIPVGTRVQSVPAQDEKAQSFETTAAAPARADWNAIPVETSVPWRPKTGDTELWLEGVATQLQAGDAILIVGADRQTNSDSEDWEVRVLSAVQADLDNDRTRLRWDDPLGSAFPAVGDAGAGAQVHAFRERSALFGHNAPDPNLMGNDDSNVAALIDIETDPDDWEWIDFHIDPDAIDLDSNNKQITANSWVALVSNESGSGSASLPGFTELVKAGKVIHRTRNAFGISSKATRIFPDTTTNITTARYDLRRTLVLAASERLRPSARPSFHPVYGDGLTLAGPVEGLKTDQPIALSGPRQRIEVAPRVTNLQLFLKDGSPVPLAAGDGLFLMHAAAVIIHGRPYLLPAKFLAAVIGISSVQLLMLLMDRDGQIGLMLAWANQIMLAPSTEDDPVVSEIAFIDTLDEPSRDYSKLKLSQPLANVYERASLRVNANVAAATHGETVEEILGSGDGAVANQRFSLAQSPLTFVSAKTPAGSASTLELRVNDVLWKAVPTLHAAAPDTRVYSLNQDDDGVTSVQFGDGEEGARLPSGEGNVRVRYRKFLGTEGNLNAGKLTTLLSRPLGVSEVVNPVPATGGDDPETLDKARDNAPLTVLTLDRAVSIADYANFARAFAGIDKAHALWVPAGPARGVFLTIAGVDGANVPETSDTYKNLLDSLSTYGDPLVPLRLGNYADARFRCRLSIKVLAEFAIDPVLLAVDAALTGHFSFPNRDFGQTASVDEVSAVAQGVKGVEAVHVTLLYRSGDPATMEPRLFATLPVVSLTTLPQPAELLRLDEDAIELEVLP